MTEHLIQSHSKYLFPAQIALANIKDFSSYKQDLISWVYNYQKVDYGTMISNRGGYQSESKEIFLENSFFPFKNKILSAINELVKEFQIIRPIKIVQMWVNVNGQYCYNTSHKHAGVELSGVLWIKQTKETGVFVFENNETGLQTASLNAATKWEHTENQNTM